MKKGLFPILCLTVLCQAQVPFFGPCPFINSKQNFNSRILFGKWYEIEKYSTFQPGSKCVTTTFTPFFGDQLSISIKDDRIDILTNTPVTISGTATQVGLPIEARFEVVYPTSLIPATYWVLETDYISYAVLYSCVNFYFYHYKYVRLLSRELFPLGLNPSAYYALDVRGISRAFLMKTDQLNCPAF